jgi:hypothetical protein
VPATKHLNIKASNPSIVSTLTLCEILSSLVWLTTNINYSVYLFIVTTPGKLTGWIGLPTESTTSIIIALKQWLTDTELIGRTQSV